MPHSSLLAMQAEETRHIFHWFWPTFESAQPRQQDGQGHGQGQKKCQFEVGENPLIMRGKRKSFQTRVDIGRLKCCPNWILQVSTGVSVYRDTSYTDTV